MPRQRDVKPWTIYPPTQEDRDIIEQKAAAASLSVSAYLCMVGKLACVTVNIPTEQEVLSEQEPVIEQPAKAEPTYTLTDQYGKPLLPKLEELVRVEYEAGKVQLQPEPQEQDFYGDLVDTKWKRKGKLYQCTHIDLDSEIPFGFTFRVIKEA